MRHLLSGVAVAAALVISVPGFAQNNPSGGNPVGTLGPNPGGPGLTPYTGGGAPAAPAATPTTPPAAAAAAPAAANSAKPPSHHHYAYHHAKAMHHFHKSMARKAALTGDTTAQLNREELARIQSGNLSNPPAPPPASK